MIAEVDRWNHNIHYHRVILSSLPADCACVLDVGCGDGVLTKELQSRAGVVIGLDRDEPTVARAKNQPGEGKPRFVVADVLRAPFRSSAFDAVVSIATLHHMAAKAGLVAMADLIRPGGTLVVVGLARSVLPRDLPRDVVAVVVSRLIRLRRGYAEISAPTVWPPPLTYRQMKRVTERCLPGTTFRRHLLWRYSILWTKPR